MQAYGDQVGGHLGNLYSLNGKVVKPCTLRELEFYKQANGSKDWKPLLTFLPQYFGSHDIQGILSYLIERKKCYFGRFVKRF
jgi:hypothetical protein